MAIKPKYQLKDLFQTGDLISQGSMNDLIDSTYNPSLIAGSNIFITGVDTPSGRQITISSSGGGGGGGTPSGSDTEIQYNNSGVFGSDPGFIRTPKGFFASQAEGGPLQAETIVGSGDFTEGGGDPIFATGSLFFDDETDIFCLAGDLTSLTGEKSIVNYILGPIARSFYLHVQDEVDIITENIAGDEVTSISAATNEAVLKHESPTLTTQIIVDTLGVTFNFNEGSDVYTFPTTVGTAGQALTTDGVGQLSWAGEYIRTAKLTIATADVLTLNTTPIEIVAAPGAGKVIEVISANMKMVFNSVAYATNTTLQIETSTGDESHSVGSISQVADAFYKLQMEEGVTGSIQFVDNQAVVVSVGTGNPTAGDSDITIYVTYRIITL